MIRLITALFLSCVFLTPGLAANIRSGEHADFSRLVIQFDDTFDWSFGRSDSGYILRSKGLEVPLDTSDVYRYIPRDRIARLSLDEDRGEFSIEVQCDCHGDAFEIRSGRVVIDIKDGPAPTNSKFERLLGPGPDPSPVRQEQAEEPIGAAAIEKPSSPPMADAAPATVAPIDTSAFASELIAGLGRAMSQGLVAPGLPLEQIVRVEDQEPEVEPEPESEKGPVDAIEPPKEEIGSSALTQVEVDRLKRFLSDPVRQMNKCAKFEDLDFALNESNPLEVVQDQRAKLFDPMGRLSQSSAFELAVGYLSLGFGAEALEILEVVDQTDHRTAAFKAIGAILEHQPITEANPFWGQIECRGGYVIWEILSRDAPSRLDAEHLRGIQLHFLELPKQLRRRVGPDLGAKLAEAGYLEVAQVIRNSLVRAETSEFAALRSLDASMELEMDNHVAAIRHLEDMVLEDNTESPEALVRLFETYAEYGVEPAKQFEDLLSSYSFELQGSVLGRQLALLEAEFLIRGDKLSDAILAISRFEKEERPLTEQEVVRLTRLAIETSSDIVFARYVLENRQTLASVSLDPDLFEDAVTRLISDNFVEAAKEIVARSSIGEQDLRALLEKRIQDKQSSILIALEAQ